MSIKLDRIWAYDHIECSNLAVMASELRVRFSNGRNHTAKIPHPATPKQVAMRLRELADNIEHDAELQK